MYRVGRRGLKPQRELKRGTVEPDTGDRSGRVYRAHLMEWLLKLGYEVIRMDSFTNYYPRERELKNLSRVAEKTGDRLRVSQIALQRLEVKLNHVHDIASTLCSCFEVSVIR